MYLRMSTMKDRRHLENSWVPSTITFNMVSFQTFSPEVMGVPLDDVLN